MYGCTGVQVPPPFHTFYSHALGCVGMCCHSPYYWKLLEPPGTPRILLDVPHPQYQKCMAALMCRYLEPIQTWKPRSWCWGVDSWGRRILRTMGWWRKVNLCSTLWVRLLKASDTIRLWNSMFDKNKTEVERAIRNGQGWIRSTHFNHLQPKAQPKKTSFRYRAILKKMLEKGTLTIDKNQKQLLHTIAFSTFRLLKTTFMYNECAAWNCCWPPRCIHSWYFICAPPHLNPPFQISHPPLQTWELLMY